MGLRNRLSLLFVDEGSGDDDELVYQCQQCGATFELQYHVCPECNAFSIEGTDW